MDLQSTWDQELKHEFRLKVKKLTNQIVALRVEEAEAKQAWKEKRTERKAALRELEAHLLADDGSDDDFATQAQALAQAADAADEKERETRHQWKEVVQERREAMHKLQVTITSYMAPLPLIDGHAAEPLPEGAPELVPTPPAAPVEEDAMKGESIAELGLDVKDLVAAYIAPAFSASRDDRPVKVKPLTIAGKLFVVISAESQIGVGRAWNLRPLYPFAEFEIDYVHIPTRTRPGVLNCVTCDEDWWAGVCVKVKGVKGDVAIGPKLEQRRLVELAEEPAHA